MSVAMPPLADLYLEDETAWLEAMAELVRRRDLAALDLEHLAEYLEDMARRDRREARSRLVVLLAHLLKWGHQPGRRTRSWRATIVEQRQELAALARRGVLRRYAEEDLAGAYADAVERAATETGLPPGTFPAACPWTVEALLTTDLTADAAS